MLSKEDEKYYEDYFDLFSRNGWKNFEDEITDALANLQSDLEVASDPEVYRIQGQIKELKFFKHFRESITRAYDELKNPTVVEVD